MAKNLKLSKLSFCYFFVMLLSLFVDHIFFYPTAFHINGHPGWMLAGIYGDDGIFRDSYLLFFSFRNCSIK